MNTLGPDRPLYILPFDHRGSFETKMFGWHDDLTPEQTGKIAAAKQVNYDGFTAALAVQQWIGAFTATVGGLGARVFARGIGEHAPTVRARICDGLGFLGIALEEERNAANEGVISKAAGRVAVRVKRTDEERMIAETVCRVLGLGGQKEE